MVQRLLIASVIGVVLVFAGTAYVDAQQAPPKFCGDGIVQAPNDAGVMELCDAGPDGNDVCSPQCGHKLLGWGWFSTAGWISLNRANCNYTLEQTSGFSSPCSSQDIDYFTAVQPDGSVEGWAWSANLGWICFGQTCGSLDAQYGQQAPQTGWIARADAVDPNIEPEVRGWAKMTTMGDRGWISLNCSNGEAEDTCVASDYQSKVGLDSFYSGGTTETRQPTLIGFGWHSTGEAGSLGWVQFSPSTTPPWLQTRRGDVYAGGGIIGSRPRGLFNATYRILGSGDIQFESEKGSSIEWIDPNYGVINFPTPETRYSNVLGKIDRRRLLCTPVGESKRCRNASGNTVVYVDSLTPEPGNPDAFNPVLSDVVYYVDGDLTINQAIEFKNAPRDTLGSGAGTIVVKGDLIIDADITYDQSNHLSRFKNLASAAWLVGGNMRVAGTVTRLAGAFIVLGDQCESGQPCGQIATGASTNFLETSGLMMAKQFAFERQVSSPLQGSEIVLYDGRLLANVPPGLANFASALPIWRSGSFAQ